MSTEWPNSHYISLQSLFVLTHSGILADCVEVGSNSLDVSFCVDTLKDAIAQYGCSEIFNTELAASSHHTDQHGWRWLASRLVPILISTIKNVAIRALTIEPQIWSITVIRNLRKPHDFIRFST